MENLSRYISHKKGTIPLILSVPHGGEESYKEIPTRSGGILGIDKNTISLAQELIDHIQNAYLDRNCKIEKPSFIYCNITRSKIDLNRPIEKAFDQSSVLAKNIYQFYHDTLRKYINYNIETFKRSLMLDIHGFETKSRPKGFRDVDIIIGTDNLKSLYNKTLKKKDWSKNIRGEIVKKFLELEIPIAPGHQRRREYVLSGGYITKKYGASNIKNSQTIQIEFSDRIRIHNKNLKTFVLKSLAKIIYKEFHSINLLHD
jgi:N-formylglutamate amidohydrolase